MVAQITAGNSLKYGDVRWSEEEINEGNVGHFQYNGACCILFTYSTYMEGRMTNGVRLSNVIPQKIPKNHKTFFWRNICPAKCNHRRYTIWGFRKLTERNSPERK
jgi:hypothetical protein